MTETNIKETVNLFKQLSPQNQAYFMKLVQVADMAENNAKKALTNPSPALSGNKPV